MKARIATAMIAQVGVEAGAGAGVGAETMLNPSQGGEVEVIAAAVEVVMLAVLVPVMNPATAQEVVKEGPSISVKRQSDIDTAVEAVAAPEGGGIVVVPVIASVRVEAARVEVPVLIQIPVTVRGGVIETRPIVTTEGGSRRAKRCTLVINSAAASCALQRQQTPVNRAI